MESARDLEIELCKEIVWRNDIDKITTLTGKLIAYRAAIRAECADRAEEWYMQGVPEPSRAEYAEDVVGLRAGRSYGSGQIMLDRQCTAKFVLLYLAKGEKMANFDSNRFASKNQTFETPDHLFGLIDGIFHFTVDVCASAENTKCPKFYSEENSCLDKEWEGVCWMNPPFKDMKKFIKKAFDERERAITVCLIPARTNTKWWHELCMKGEIWFLEGRPKFKGCVHGLPQPLALVIFGKGCGIMQSFNIERGLTTASTQGGK